MQNTKGLALEVRLSAYLDGEVSETERKELEQLVARDDEARMLLEMLKAGNAFGNKAFEEFLHDPVPLSLVRRIKQGPGVNPKAERVVNAAPRQTKVRLWPRALAASITLLLIGSSTGYIIGRTSNEGTPSVNVAAARTWLDDIADYHRIYSRQTAEHLVEVPASSGAKIEGWLASRIVRQLLAGLLMVGALYAIKTAIPGWFSGSAGHRLVGVMALVGGGMAVYFPAVWLFGGTDKEELRSLFRRRRPYTDVG